MGKHYILIDYENVQPKSLSVLLGAPNRAFRIMVFVGASQSKRNYSPQIFDGITGEGDLNDHQWIITLVRHGFQIA